MIEPPSVPLAPATLAARYRPECLEVFNDAERRRFLAPLGPDADAALAGDEDAFRRIAPRIAWQLLYRVEPWLYERLVAGESIHREVLARLPRHAHRAVEVGAGTGRLTAELVPRCDELVAIEPAAPMRAILHRKLPSVDVRDGFLDATGLPDRWADLVVVCSALTPDPAHGGDDALEELERIVAPDGTIMVVWPSGVEWLCEHGYRYERFNGRMAVTFRSVQEAVSLARIFYPHAAREIARRGARSVPYEVLGMDPPCDLAWRRAA